MGSLTMSGHDAALLAWLTPSSFPRPDGLWVALTTQVPSDEMTGDDLVEITDPAYERALIEFDDGWVHDSAGRFVNAFDIQFDSPISSGWLIVGWALTTASSGGLVMACGALYPVSVIEVGQAGALIPAGTISIALGSQ